MGTYGSPLKSPTAIEIIKKIEEEGFYRLKPRKKTAFFFLAVSLFFLWGSIITFGDDLFMDIVTVGLCVTCVVFVTFVISGYDTSIYFYPEGCKVGKKYFTWEDIKYYRFLRHRFGKDVFIGYVNPKKTPKWNLEETHLDELLIINFYDMSSQSLAELITALQVHFLESKKTLHG
jgi:hypothetical protein